MSRLTVTLVRLFGVRIRVHVSWLVVYALVTLGLARTLHGVRPSQAYAFGAVAALGLFASVVVHELGHVLVARRFGVQTRAITLFLLGGVAVLEDEPPSPRAEVLVAAAGPAVSAVLAAVALAALELVVRTISGATGAQLALLAAYLAVANAVLAGFNLIPAYPMDGGRMLRALLWRRHRCRFRATVVAARVGIAFALLLVAAGVAAAAAARNPLYGWYVVPGAFLLRAGWTQQHMEVAPAA